MGSKRLSGIFRDCEPEPSKISSVLQTVTCLNPKFKECSLQ
jgi:hypothetical protein